MAILASGVTTFTDPNKTATDAAKIGTQTDDPAKDSTARIAELEKTVGEVHKMLKTLTEKKTEPEKKIDADPVADVNKRLLELESTIIKEKRTAKMDAAGLVDNPLIRDSLLAKKDEKEFSDALQALREKVPAVFPNAIPDSQDKIGASKGKTEEKIPDAVREESEVMGISAEACMDIIKDRIKRNPALKEKYNIQ